MSAARLALLLLVVGQAIQWGAVLIGGLVYPDYDPWRQYISELGATGAATGRAVSWLGFFPSGLLIVGFCLIAAAIMRRNALAAVGLLLLAWYAFGLIGAALYPCAFECQRAEPTLSQMLHDLIGGTGYLAGLAGLLLTAVATRDTVAKGLAPLGYACFALAMIGFAGLVADVEMRGLFQRVLEASLTVFLLAVGWKLAQGHLRAPERT